ncbi:MAG: UDP-3-O-(3-hydroxymyristoyl)glucosamine N-acyltransferase [Parvularculales bacterium]
MADKRFFLNTGPYVLEEIARKINGTLDETSNPALKINDVASLEAATPYDISFLSNSRSRKLLRISRAGACILKEQDKSITPSGMHCIFSDDPARSFAVISDLFYPETDYHPNQRHLSPESGGYVDPSAILEEGVIIESGAVIGANAIIGKDTLIMGNSYVGESVTLGRGCILYPNVTVTHAFIGDRVVMKSGACVGQPGFGFAMSLDHHTKIPQLGRVIIQNDVLIGANTTVDRGTLSDTIIGEGTKIDNLVHIGHNCVLGRHCVIAGCTGLAGSTICGDFVVMGGQTASAGHLKVGSYSFYAGRSGIMRDMPSGGRYGGLPAKPVKEWLREIGTLSSLAKRSRQSDENKGGNS